jgi:hypothetical protein
MRPVTGFVLIVMVAVTVKVEAFAYYQSPNVFGADPIPTIQMGPRGEVR